MKQYKVGQKLKYNELKLGNHPDYDPDTNDKLIQLAEGNGFEIQKNPKLLLPMLPGIEDVKAYNERVKSCAYSSFLSQFGTQFSASLFSEPLIVKMKEEEDGYAATKNLSSTLPEPYNSFIEHVNGPTSPSLSQFAQQIFDIALYELCCYVVLDLPNEDINVINRSQEDLLSETVIAYTIPYNKVTNWKKLADGSFAWLVIEDEVMIDDDPYLLDQKKYTYTVPRMSEVIEAQYNDEGIQSVPAKDAVCVWEIWETDLMKMKEKRLKDTVFTLKYVIETDMPRVNVLPFCMDPKVHLGTQLGPMCAQYYQRDSLLISNSNKTMFCIGMLKIADDIGAIAGLSPNIKAEGKEAEQITKGMQLRAKAMNSGFIIGRADDGKGDTLEFLEPTGTSHKFISEEQSKSLLIMHEIVRQMQVSAKSSTQALGRSAQSKLADRHSTSMLLTYYETITKNFIDLCLDFIVDCRKEDYDFEIDGLSTLEPQPDRSVLVNEVAALGINILLFPAIFKEKYLNALAQQLIDSDMEDDEKAELLKQLQADIASGKWDAPSQTEMLAAGNKMPANTPPGFSPKKSPSQPKANPK